MAKDFTLPVSPSVQARRKAQAEHERTTYRPGESFEQHYRRVRQSGRAGDVDVLRTVDASSALSERDRLRVAGLRADIKNNVTSQIPDDLRPYVRDLLGPTPEEIAAEAQATSREILASVQQMQDTDISAAVALDWQREHSLALPRNPSPGNCVRPWQAPQSSVVPSWTRVWWIWGFILACALPWL